MGYCPFKISYSHSAIPENLSIQKLAKSLGKDAITQKFTLI